MAKTPTAVATSATVPPWVALREAGLSISDSHSSMMKSGSSISGSRPPAMLFELIVNVMPVSVVPSVPFGQSVHAGMPGASEKVAPMHCSHVAFDSARKAAEAVPFGHGAQLTEPFVSAKVPGKHARQFGSVPPGRLSNEPRGHTMQLRIPCSFANVPGSQMPHAPWRASG